MSTYVTRRQRAERLKFKTMVLTSIGTFIVGYWGGTGDIPFVPFL